MLGTLFFALSLFLGTVFCSDGTLFDKIVGGRKAAPNEYTFQASLLKRAKSGYYHTCGAVLVAPDWLLTAAHCIKSNSTNDYKIMTGSNFLGNVSYDNIYSVMTIIVKQGYDYHNFNNDIALIEISTAAENFVENAIKLPDFPPDINITATVIGWGATSDGGSVSLDLLSADVDIIPHDDCLKYYNYITESMMCAGYPDGQVDACQGDSGGPLIQKRADGVYLVGIVSWGIGCAEPDHPGVYTDVATFNAWIRHYITSSNV